MCTCLIYTSMPLCIGRCARDMQKIISVNTSTLANTKSSRGQAYNKLEINIYLSSSLSSRARSTWCYTEYNVTYLPNKSIFLFHITKRKMKESEMKENRNSDSNNKLRCTLYHVYYFINTNLFLQSTTWKNYVFYFTINNLPDKEYYTALQMANWSARQVNITNLFLYLFLLRKITRSDSRWDFNSFNAEYFWRMSRIRGLFCLWCASALTLFAVFDSADALNTLVALTVCYLLNVLTCP